LTSLLSFCSSEARTTEDGYFELNVMGVMRHSIENAKKGFRRAFNVLKVNIRQWGLKRLYGLL